MARFRKTISEDKSGYIIGRMDLSYKSPGGDIGVVVDEVHDGDTIYSRALRDELAICSTKDLTLVQAA